MWGPGAVISGKGEAVEIRITRPMRSDIREEIILKEIYFERLWSVDVILKWRAKLAETYR